MNIQRPVSLTREHPALNNEWWTPVSEHTFPFPIGVLLPHKMKQIPPTPAKNNILETPFTFLDSKNLNLRLVP